MNTKHEIHNAIKGKCPQKYRINEILPFNYPFTKVKAEFLINKAPEASLKEIYKVILSAIKAGVNTRQQLKYFLGLSDTDFLWKELFYLRDQGILNISNDEYFVPTQGDKFLEDVYVPVQIETESYEFLIERMQGELISSFILKAKEGDPTLKSQFAMNHDTGAFIKNNFGQISGLYKAEHGGESFMIDFNEDTQAKSNQLYQSYILVEYLPLKEDDSMTPYIEVLEPDHEYKRNKKLENILRNFYPEVVYELSDGERGVITLPVIESSKKIVEEKQSKSQHVDLWDAAVRFRNAINDSKKSLYIEMPRLTKAALKYINPIEAALKRKVKVILIFGLQGYEHDTTVVHDFEKLKSQYSDLFFFVNLPEHAKRNSLKYTGTHKRILVKDFELMFLSSFNFFGQGLKGEKPVANEEIVLLEGNFKTKVNLFLNEYKLDIEY